MVEYQRVERRTVPINIVPGEKLIIRVWKWDEETLIKDAEDGYYIDTVETGSPPPYYSISAFALPLSQGETIDELVDRLSLHAADHRRFKWYCLVTEPELISAGFQLILNEPPDDHYDIPVGVTRVDAAEVAKLVLLFADEKIRMRS